MNCRNWEAQLALYVGGDLPKEQAAKVERHLGECPACQMFASGLKESQELLLDLHREPLDPAHYAAVRARVLAQLEGRRSRFNWALGFAAIAAALLVLAIAPASWPLHPRLTGPKPRIEAPVVTAGRPLVPAPENALVGGRIFTTERASPALPRRRTSPAKSPHVEQVLINVVSEDPGIVIYWIADTRGD